METQRVLELYQNKISKLENLVKVHKEYEFLLNDEIDDLVGYVHYRGWKSKNIEKGVKFREKISELEKELNI